MSYEWFDKTYTPEGGRYYRAYAFFWASVVAIFPIGVMVVAIAYLNPFWFRHQLMDTIGDVVEGFCMWRNYKMKSIYMNCDPEVWAILTAKETNENDYA